MSLLQNSNAIEVGGYTISNSLRFRSSASAYLSRTFSAPTDNKKWTISAWIKKGGLGTSVSSGDQPLISAPNGANADTFWVEDNGTDQFSYFLNSVVVARWTPVYRDPSSWYHVVFVYDTANSTQADRLVLYINGSRVTTLSTAVSIALNQSSTINANAVIARLCGNPINTRTFDGYLAEVNFIDGQALTPSSFGQIDTLTGVWTAKKYTGTYGTNGFYLPFSDTTSATTLAYDKSGNGNNWTANNISTTAGVTYDAMIDSPTLGVANTRPVGNYAVMNPLWKASNLTLAGANLNVTSTGLGGSALSSIAMPSGKWYCEATINTGSDATIVGIANNGFNPTTTTITSASSVGYYSNGDKFVNGTQTAYGASYTTNDIVGIALDVDAGTIVFYKNGVSQGSITHGLTGQFYFATSDVSSGSNINQSWNFGQRPFSYTPPTGFKALCTTNLPDSVITKGNQYMDATLYTGTGANLTVTNAGGFQPDIVWCKARSLAYWNHISDSVRGVNRDLFTNATDAEYYYSTSGSVTSFNSNGFSLGTQANEINTNGGTFVAWQWDAGSSTVTNTDGSISSQVRANPTAGVSVVTATKTGTPQTVGHGLGVKPAMIIVKNRAATSDWIVAHKSLNMSSEIIILNSTAAKQSVSWGGEPTSTVFYVSNSMLGNNDFVAYCFAEIAGFSKFGSYTGNGSADGSFVYTNLLAKFILIKRTDTTGNWIMWDTVRNTYNVLGEELYPNLSNAAASSTDLDVLSNGFKPRSTNAAFNASGGTYIYGCFALNPFKNSNAF